MIQATKRPNVRSLFLAVVLMSIASTGASARTGEEGASKQAPAAEAVPTPDVTPKSPRRVKSSTRTQGRSQRVQPARLGKRQPPPPPRSPLPQLVGKKQVSDGPLDGLNL
jgi:hypothetical protein